MATKQQIAEDEQRIYNMSLGMIRKDVDVSDWIQAQATLRDDIVPLMKTAYPHISNERIGHWVFRAGNVVYGEHVRKLEDNQ